MREWSFGVSKYPTYFCVLEDLLKLHLKCSETHSRYLKISLSSLSNTSDICTLLEEFCTTDVSVHILGGDNGSSEI